MTLDGLSGLSGLSGLIGASGGGGGTGNFLALETAFHFLLEDGSGSILLES